MRKALKDRSNYVAAKAAAIAAERQFHSLEPDLLAAFDRFMKDPAKSDPQCWAKNAIAKALKDFSYADPSIFFRGVAHVQLEPVWGGRQDTAATLRGICALALIGTTAASFENPDFVDVVIQSYQHRHQNAPGDPALATVEDRLASQPAITVPTIVLHGEADGVGPVASSADHAKHFTNSYERRVIPVAGHFLPNEAPEAVVQAIVDLGRRS